MDSSTIITGIITGVSTFVGYFIGARKTNAETDKIVIENVREILEVYSLTINDLKNEVRELKQRITEYETHIEKLNTELNKMRRELNDGNTTNTKRTRPSKTNP